MNNNTNKKFDPASTMLLLTNDSPVPVARGLLENSPDDPNIQLRIIDGSPDAVVAAQYVQVVSMSNSVPPRLGSVIQRRGNRIVLEPLRPLSEEVRRSLRMPVVFDSFIYYPLTELQKRIPIKSNDLSCGGISFFANCYLDIGDQIEVFVPITKVNPLLLTCQILRKRDETDGRTFYAGKFIDIIDEQEALVCEAVFNVQLKRGA